MLANQQKAPHHTIGTLTRSMRHVLHHWVPFSLLLTPGLQLRRPHHQLLPRGGWGNILDRILAANLVFFCTLSPRVNSCDYVLTAVRPDLTCTRVCCFADRYQEVEGEVKTEQDLWEEQQASGALLFISLSLSLLLSSL